jgi:hypothetical protein
LSLLSGYSWIPAGVLALLDADQFFLTSLFAITPAA